MPPPHFFQFGRHGSLSRGIEPGKRDLGGTKILAKELHHARGPERIFEEHKTPEGLDGAADRSESFLCHIFPAPQDRPRNLRWRGATRPVTAKLFPTNPS